MRKKRGILGKIVIGVIVLGIIGAVFGGNDEPPKEDLAPISQEQQVQEQAPVKQPEAPKEQPKQGVPKETEQTQPVQTEEPKLPEKSSGIRPELKEFLESYESFMDEYCEFMENYNASDMTMLMKYTELLSKYSDFAGKADKWQSEDMNSEELVYYTEVLNRVSIKLLEVSQNM